MATLQGTSGDDTLSLAGSSTPITVVDGGAGTDTFQLSGNSGLNGITLRSIERLDFQSTAGSTLMVSTDPDVLVNGGVETLNGGAGQDVLIFSVNGGGSYTIPYFTETNWTDNGRTTFTGNDIIELTVVGPLAANNNYVLNASNDGSGGHSGVELLRGGTGDDTLNGTNGLDLLDGGTGGTDVLHGGGGNDALVTHGVSGNAPTTISTSSIAGVYDGGSGFDYLWAAGGSTFNYFSYYNMVDGQEHVVSAGSLTSIEGIHTDVHLVMAADTLSQLPANFTLDGAGVLDIEIGPSGMFDGSAIQFAAGATAAIAMNGSSASETMIGTSGADSLYGNDGHDDLYGGPGADSIDGGNGNDHLYGQSATGGPDGADVIHGGDGTDYLQGNAGNDTLYGDDGPDRINGGANDDLISGGNGNDTVNGNLGNDSISGDDGNDSLRGGQGNDTIDGGNGNDLISGDLGQDKLTGGAGADTFQFSGAASPVTTPDQITDFTHGSDLLSIGFHPLALLTGAAQPDLATAAGEAQQLFDANAGNQEVAVIAVGSDAYLFYASDGGPTVDSALLLAGVAPSAISLSDFV